MVREDIVSEILKGGIVSILRVADPKKILPASRAILEGGIKAIEISLNTPQALEGISDLSKIEGIIPGVGTVTNVEMAIKSIECGAEFVVTPVSKKEIIDACHELGKPVFSGAFTPSEIYQAYEWGADVIKVFPAETLGMKYIKAVLAPFPEIRLMPTGGVTPDNIDKWFDMGAVCVGVGGSFTKAEIFDNEDWKKLTDIAHEFYIKIGEYKTQKEF